MPEIKKNFSAGKMNKDLDERIVPNGEYRHALNIRVSTSDASDVGAVNNILSNQKIGIEVPSLLGLPTPVLNPRAKCVGTVSNEDTNQVYWFIWNANDSDLIVQIDIRNFAITPVVTDVDKTCLKFSENLIVTGINIIDGLLFWTDNFSEPKKINIKNSILGTPGFNSQSKLHNPAKDNIVSGYTDSSIDLKEEHITVIKRGPTRQPSVVLTQLDNLNQPGVIKRFRFADNNQVLWGPGNYPGSNYTNSVTGLPEMNFEIFNSSASQDYDVRPGTIIHLKAVKLTNVGQDVDADGLIDELNSNFNQEYAYAPDYDIRCVINSIDPTQSQAPTGAPLTGSIDVRADILSIAPNTPRNFQLWVVNFEQAADPLFENKFPRFAYRYKYIDGEYSPFSPFSDVAFLPYTYSFDSINGYNSGMRNYLQKVTLQDFVQENSYVNPLNPGIIQVYKTPDDVVGIDLLYKESNSPAVYVIDSLTPDGSEWNTQTSTGVSAGSYDITSDTITKILPSNQILRSYDSVPKQALSQEVVGNRIVYGNYVENLNLQNLDLDVTFRYFQTGVRIQDEIAVPSIKTLRNYQLGIVYEDLYGRQTPVLTNKNLTLNVPITESANQIRFEAKINNSAPSEAQFFKFFVKETATEYYNLALSRWYDASDGNIWCSFNSADRNKVDEETYLYLKKSHGGDTAIFNPAKYKILAISNEAPEYIRKADTLIDNVLHDNSAANPLFPDHTFFPLKQKNKFKLSAEVVDNTGFAGIENMSDLEMILTQPDENNQSEVYKITNVSLDNTNNDFYIVSINGDFGDDVDFVDGGLNNNGVQTLNDGIFLKITDSTPENAPEFDGKFFVKINKDFNFTTFVLRESNNLDDLTIVHQEPLRYYKQSVLAATNDHFSEDGGNDFDIDNSGGGGMWYTSSANRSQTLFGDGTSTSTLDADGPRWFIDELNHEGEPVFLSSGYVNAQGNSTPGRSFGDNQTSIDISFSNIQNNGGLPFQQWDSKTWWDVGKESNSKHDDEADFVKYLKAGSKFYYSSDADKKIFTITNVEITKLYNYADGIQGQPGTDPSKVPATSLGYSQADEDLYAQPYNRRIRYRIFLDDTNATTDVGVYGGTNLSEALNQTVTLNFVENLSRKRGSISTSANPAVFETKPKNTENLEIYHEASQSYHITRHGQTIDFSWFNAYIFGNGVESNRVQDDFNAPFIDNGPKVSSTFEGEYKKERFKNRLTYSGIYNSKNSINRTNEFISAEKITKNLNPEYGSIQKLYTRDSDLVAFCEDKVLRILANKDAVFNADGNPNLIATPNVLGQTVPFVGDYGISKNPESFAKEGYRAYFADKQRGAILRLSRDGLTTISQYGMTDYFKDNLPSASKILGSYDTYNDEYNVTFSNETISFDEKVNGWVSFKSYAPEVAGNCANRYFSFKDGEFHIHDAKNSISEYNNFYGVDYESSITFLLNDVPGSVKNFKTLNYEGSQAKVIENLDDNNYYNLENKDGWYASSIKTDLQQGKVNEFIKKESKWFNNIKGDNQTAISTNNFNFQGVGSMHSSSTPVFNPVNLVAPVPVIYVDPLIVNDPANGSYPITFRIQTPQYQSPSNYQDSPTDFDYQISANINPFGLGGIASGTATIYNNLSFITYPSQFGPTLYQADVITPTPVGAYTGINPVTFDVTFYWRDTAGQVLYQETKSTSLNLIAGCTDPNATNFTTSIPPANINDGSCLLTQHIPPNLQLDYYLSYTSTPIQNAPDTYHYHFYFDFGTMVPGFSSAYDSDPNHEPYTYTLEWAVDSGSDDESYRDDGWLNGWQNSPPTTHIPNLPNNFALPLDINNHMNSNSKFISPATNGYTSPFVLGGGQQQITMVEVPVTEGQGPRIFGFRIKFSCQQGHGPEFSNIVNITLPDSQ